jgi:hypothetical protein
MRWRAKGTRFPGGQPCFRRYRQAVSQTGDGGDAQAHLFPAQVVATEDLEGKRLLCAIFFSHCTKNHYEPRP